jgi:hypothetical protein
MNRTSFRILVLLIAVSVLLRVGAALYMGDSTPPSQDDTSYSLLAASLLSGHGYSFDRPWYPFGKPVGYPTAFWSFLYPAFVAGVYAVFGVHPLAARLVGAVLGGILMPWLVYRLSRRLFPGRERVALLAAGCAACYAYFILYAARPLTETFYIVALLWSLERALALTERPAWGGAVLLGLALGLAALLRQSILPWVPVLFAWLLWAGWRGVRNTPARLALLPASCLLLLATCILALCILPFTIRNYIVYGDFLLLNSNTGYAMYSAQHPFHGTRFEEHEAAPFPEDLRALDEPAADRALMRRAMGFVLEEPGRYLLLSLSRVEDYFRFWPTADSSLLYNVGRVVSFGLFLPFMLAGIVLALRRAGPLRTGADWARFSTTPLALILLFATFYSLLHILTWAMIRYRLPVDAVLMPFAALALYELIGAVWRRLFSRRLKGERVSVGG